MASAARAAASEPADEGGERPECLDADLGWLLVQASFALASETARALAPLGLSPRAYHVLAAALHGERTQSELGELVGVDKTTMVVTLDELEAAGLAERRPVERDRRARRIAVTPAGRRKVARGREVVERVQADVLDTLPAAQRAALLHGLATLVRERLAEPLPCEPPLRRREPRA